MCCLGFLYLVIFHSPRVLPAERFHFLFRREAVGRTADTYLCGRKNLRPCQRIQRAVSPREMMQEAAEQGVPRAHGVDDFPHLHGGQGENAVSSRRYMAAPSALLPRTIIRFP